MQSRYHHRIYHMFIVTMAATEVYLSCIVVRPIIDVCVMGEIERGRNKTGEG